MQYSGPGTAAREEEAEICARMPRQDGRCVLQEVEGGIGSGVQRTRNEVDCQNWKVPTKGLLDRYRQERTIP